MRRLVKERPSSYSLFSSACPSKCLARILLENRVFCVCYGAQLGSELAVSYFSL